MAFGAKTHATWTKLGLSGQEASSDVSSFSPNVVPDLGMTLPTGKAASDVPGASEIQAQILPTFKSPSLGLLMGLWAFLT